MLPDPDDIVFRPARDGMIADQIMSRQITSARVIHAMAAIPRHRFVLPEFKSRAYDDCALPAPEGQTISQPYIVAVMTQMLDLQPHHRVLEIGTGTGYQTAILAHLAREICTIERIAALSHAAQHLLISLRITNVHYHIGDGTVGWPASAADPTPLFDRILITAGAPDVPEPLIRQLAPGGILILPRGGPSEQHLVSLTRVGEILSEREEIPCRFVPLIGQHGWKSAPPTDL